MLPCVLFAFVLVDVFCVWFAFVLVIDVILCVVGVCASGMGRTINDVGTVSLAQLLSCTGGGEAGTSVAQKSYGQYCLPRTQRARGLFQDARSGFVARLSEFVARGVGG